MPDDKGGPTRALAVAVETGIDLDEVQAGNSPSTSGYASAKHHFSADETDRIWRAHARNLHYPHGVSINGHIDMIAVFFQPLQFLFKTLGSTTPQRGTHVSGASIVLGVMPVLLAYAARLRTDADISFPE